MNYSNGDLVYVDLKRNGSPPMCSWAKFVREVEIDSRDGEFDSFYQLDTEFFGLIYVDCNSSDIKLYKDYLTGN